MNVFKPIKRIESCLECGSDNLYGPEQNFWCIVCLDCDRRYPLLEDHRPAGKRPRKQKRLR